MNEKIATIEKNKTWVFMEFPKGKKVIGLKWSYKINVGWFVVDVVGNPGLLYSLGLNLLRYILFIPKAL